jgi:acyl-coenzyme A synthetase/AMP-(fatty) acid ligase
LTTGGEKYDEDLCNKLQAAIPDVKMHNIYASTETGSILNAVGKGFSIPEEYKEKVKISPEGELLIHYSLLGEFPLEGEWYNTHDLVEEKEGLLYFLSRKSDILNVGGYKVNPLEVESAMQKVPGISDCLVYGQKNSVLGTILLADVVLEEGFVEKEVKKSIRHYLQNELQDFKIPRIIQFVKEIKRTKSGKKVRK